MRNITTTSLSTLAQNLAPKKNPNVAPTDEAVAKTGEVLEQIAKGAGVQDTGSLTAAEQLLITNRYVEENFPQRHIAGIQHPAGAHVNASFA